MDAATVIKRADRAKGERDRHETVFDDAIRLTMPLRRRFNYNGLLNGMDDIFDETGANAVADFVSRMQSGLFPPFTQFMKLEASSLVDIRDRAAVNKDLDDIAEFAFEEIWASNFAQEASEGLYDLAISTSNLLVEEGTGENTLMHRSMPITEMLMERGPNDMVGGQFRISKVQASLIPPRYGVHFNEGNAPKTMRDAASSQDKELDVIEYTYRDWNAPVETNKHIVVVKNHKEVIVDRTMTGTGSSPFITHRWTTASGELWGRGPLLNALAAVRTTNLMVELVLENAAMSIVGMYQTDNDGIVNADNISLLPGTIITKEVGSNGLEVINGATGNFNMQDLVMNDQRLNIRKALFNDMLSDPNRTPASATEVVERMADLANRTSAPFARAHFEFLVPYMRRVLYVLEKRGDIKLPTLNGRKLRLRAVSPLAQAQYGRDVQGLVQDFGVRAQIFGPQVASSSYNMKNLHPWLQKRMGLDENLYNTPDEIVKSIEEQSEQIASEQQQQATPARAA